MNTELPEAIRGRTVDAREGWFRLPSAFIIELIKAKSLSGEVPVEKRWKWSEGPMGEKRLLVDDQGKVWDWGIKDWGGLWIKRKEGAPHGVA